MSKQTIKGWAINLKPYQVKVDVRDSEGNLVLRNGVPIVREDTMDVKHNLCSMLFSPKANLNPDAMFKSKDIVDKIRAAKDEVILDNAEMEIVRKAYGFLQGLPEYFIEFLSRVKDAREVELKVA